MLDVPRSERGQNARQPFNVLLSRDEKKALLKALTDENAEFSQDLGLGAKLRELGLRWAKLRREQGKVKK